MIKVRRMAWLLGGAGVLIAAGVGIANYNWYKNVTVPPLSYFAGAKLQALDGSSTTLLGSDIWNDKPAVVMIVRRPG